jgi:hypothetical protein
LVGAFNYVYSFMNIYIVRWDISELYLLMCINMQLEDDYVLL